MILAGLGNPGTRYEKTRHNLGFLVIDLILERWGRPHLASKFHSQVAVAEPPFLRERQILLKPQTFMNLSGDAVAPAVAFYKLTPRDVLVIHDELDIPLGRLQLKMGGGAGGHNGIKSVIERLGTPDFPRLRLGIGRPPADFKGDVASFVLESAPPSDATIVEKMVEAAADAVEEVLKQGFDQAMNQVNRRS
jgi:peptidyl-tRNA hydrolase, PTH1 family